MSTSQELKVQQKQEVGKPEESTVPARYYVPQTDIFEDDEKLTVVMEMPGVARDDISIDLERDRLNVEGRIDFSKYDGMEPLYTEYDVGHYKRGFTLSNKIDHGGISAELKDGVLTLHLPKSHETRPRKIQIG